LVLAQGVSRQIFISDRIKMRRVCGNASIGECLLSITRKSVSFVSGNTGGDQRQDKGDEGPFLNPIWWLGAVFIAAGATVAVGTRGRRWWGRWWPEWLFFVFGTFVAGIGFLACTFAGRFF
jgi:hypothetical protein